jgi:hypothetical protein
LSTDSQFDFILLEDDQNDLFLQLVEIARSVPRERREKFYLIKTKVGTWARHYAAEKSLDVFEGDIEALIDVGVLRQSYGSRGTLLFDITPLGYRYYEYLQGRHEEPVEAIERDVRRYLEAEPFRSRHGLAYDTWSAAAQDLWRSDSVPEFTSIGHRCREATQHFAASLAALHKPPELDPDPAHTKARIRAVLEHVGTGKGESERAFLDVLVSYWGSVVDLVQRQEHGAQKEGEELLWEDARRAVFQTAIAMFEIDRACG